jgi:pilus assembly protein CpaC
MRNRLNTCVLLGASLLPGLPALAQRLPAPATAPSSVLPPGIPTAPAAPAAAVVDSSSALVPSRNFPLPLRDGSGDRAAHARTAGALPQRMAMFPGQTAVHRVAGGLKRVAVGNGDLVDVTNIGRNEVVVIAKAEGSTSIHLWMEDGRQYSVPVTIGSGDAYSVADTVRMLLADIDNIQVHVIADRVVVTGKDVHPALPGRLESLKQIYPQLLDFTSADPVGMRPMVLMDVQIMEFNSNALEELGIKWDNVINGPGGTWIKEVERNNYFRVLPDREPFNQMDNLPARLPGTLGYFGIATTIASQINLMVNQGKAVNLASPKLSARSGGSAKFLVGGEIPIPVPQGFGQYSIDFKEYGIKLDIEPVVNSSSEISTRLLAEVSRIDPSVTVQGVPGFLTRRSESEINVRAGDTIVISGLIDSQAAKSVEKFPLLGDIPVLGKLFRSDGFRGNKTELVMFVTPRIISPDSAENLEMIERGQSLREQGSGEMRGRKQEFVQ